MEVEAANIFFIYKQKEIFNYIERREKNSILHNQLKHNKMEVMRRSNLCKQVFVGIFEELVVMVLCSSYRSRMFNLLFNGEEGQKEKRVIYRRAASVALCSEPLRNSLKRLRASVIAL